MKLRRKFLPLILAFALCCAGHRRQRDAPGARRQGDGRHRASGGVARRELRSCSRAAMRWTLRWRSVSRWRWSIRRRAILAAAASCSSAAPMARCTSSTIARRRPPRPRPTCISTATGNVIPDLSIIGYKAIGVPGSVAGLAYAQQHWGKLTLKQVMEPAIRLARDGFVLDLRGGQVVARSRPGEVSRVASHLSARWQLLSAGRGLQAAGAGQDPGAHRRKS